MQLSIEFRDHRRESELACVAGDLAIVAAVSGGAFDGREFCAMLNAIECNWPDRRVTVEVGVRDIGRMEVDLLKLGLQKDSAYGEGEPASSLPESSSRCRIRDAELRDMDQLLELFLGYAKELNELSDFTHYDMRAAESLKARLSGVLPLQAGERSRVLVAERSEDDGTEILEGVVEASSDGELVRVSWIAITGPMRRKGLGRALVIEAMMQMSGQRLAASYLMHENGPIVFWHSLGLEDKVYLFEKGAR